MKKDLNKGLLVSVIVLSLLVVGLSSYLIYDKVVERDDDKIVNDDVADKNEVTDNIVNNENNVVDKDYSNVVGRYTGSFKNADQWMSCDMYRVIEIKENGTYAWIDYSDCSNETYDISIGHFDLEDNIMGDNIGYIITLYDEKGNIKFQQRDSGKLEEIYTREAVLIKKR